MRLMKKIIGVLIPAFILLLVGYYLFLDSTSLSKDQKNTIDIFGYPSQFLITYLPRGEADNPELVRSETWFYPSQNTSISFLAGNLLSEEEYIPNGSVSTTPLHPEDFDFFMDFKDMESIFGSENILPIDFLPVFYEEGDTATYVTDLALFIIENDSLTYFQTLGNEGDSIIVEEGMPLESDNKQVEDDKETIDNRKTYKNSMLGITMKFPSEWYLLDEDIVLSTYDTGYMEKGLDLPNERLKCDFNKYNEDMLSIEDEKKIIDGDVKVYKGIAVDNSGEDGPGMGDGVMFLFEKEDLDSVALVCFSYSGNFENELFKSFETLRFEE